MHPEPPMSEDAPAKALLAALQSALDYAQTQLAHSGAEPKRLVVALSGGVDSAALLHLVSRSMGQRFSLLALHADHGLQPESRQWAEQCRKLCQRLQVPIETEAVMVADTGNLEAAARQARYSFFARHLQDNDLLLLGHHQQDQMETLLLRILQGRGFLGMRRFGSLGSGHFLRPFLSLNKAQLTAYLAAAGEPWIEDPSNAQTSFDRNYLRHEVIPALDRRWPNAASALERVAADLAAQQALLQGYARALPNPVPMAEVPQEQVQARVWMRAYLASRGHYGVKDRGIDEFFRQHQQSGRSHMALEAANPAGAASLYVWRDCIYYENRRDLAARPWPQVVTDLPWQVTWAQQTLALDTSTADTPGALGYLGSLRVLSRDQFIAPETGRLNPADRQGPGKLKHLFQRHQVPPWRRPGYPLVCDDRGLVCIPGIWSRDTAALGTHVTGYCTVGLEGEQSIGR